jgi:hypothetical protein
VIVALPFQQRRHFLQRFLVPDQMLQ